MSEKSKVPMQELFDQAMKNYETALKAGVKMQEESNRWFANLFHQPPVPPDYLKQMQAMVEQAFPATQKRMEESMKLMEQSSKTGAELLKKAVEASKATSVTEAQTKLQDFWQASLGAFQSNLTTLTQNQMKAWELWSDYVGKTAKPVGASK